MMRVCVCARNGGAPLIGYRVLMRAADEAEWEEPKHLVASTTQLEVELTNLRPQTLFRIRIVAENTHRRGLDSETLSVATAALRASSARSATSMASSARASPRSSPSPSTPRAFFSASARRTRPSRSTGARSYVSGCF